MIAHIYHRLRQYKRRGLRLLLQDGICWFRLFVQRAIQRGTLPLLIALLVLLATFVSPTMVQTTLVRDVLFVLDVSESMNVPDADYPAHGSTRLAHAQALVAAMMADLPCGSRTSIALFAGDETVVLFEPLEVCAHYPAMEKVVSQLDTRMRWIGDSWVVRGVKSALEAAQKRDMQLVFVSDSDEMPHHEHPRVAELLPFKRQLQGLLVGVGGTTLQPVPHVKAGGKVEGYWTPEEAVIEGNYPNMLAEVKALPPGATMDAGMAAEVIEHQSKLDESLLEQMAWALDATYVRGANAQAVLPVFRQTIIGHIGKTAQDARWCVGGVACLLILLSWFWPLLSRHKLSQ